MNRVVLSLIMLMLQIAAVSAQLSKAQKKYLDIIVSPDHSDWNYKTGDKPKVKVLIFKSGAPVKDVEISYSAGAEMMELPIKGKVKSGNDGASFTLPTMKTPGFLQCKISFKYEDKTYNEQVKLAFDPDKIKPTVKFPSDFALFWQQQRERLADVPLDVTKEYSEKYSNDKMNVYSISFRVDKDGHRMYGWLVVPKDETVKYPAVLLPPGAGIKKQTPSTTYAEQGIICLQMEIHGLPFDISDEAYSAARRAWGDYMFMNLDDREKYYYNRVYLGMTRAVDVLFLQKAFNGEVAATGGSQGGALSIVAAGLDKRIKAVAAFYPALCDVTGYLYDRAGGWPKMFTPQNRNFLDKKDKIDNVAYYDIVNFAKVLNIPVFFSFGYNDNTCPPTSLYSAYNSISSDKQLHITPISGHWRFVETNQKSILWLKNQLSQNVQ